MKKALLVLGGLLLAGSGQAQQLRGGFITAKSERGYSYEVFYFSGDQFAYRFEGCLGIRSGEGTLTRVGDRLLLAFRRAAADTMRRVRPFTVATTSPPTFARTRYGRHARFHARHYGCEPAKPAGGSQH